MQNSSSKTQPITVRLLNEHIEALKKLPAGETASSLVRKLLSEHFNSYPRQNAA